MQQRLLNARQVALISILITLFVSTAPQVLGPGSRAAESADQPSPPRNRVRIHLANGGNSTINLSEEDERVISYVGPEELQLALEQNRAEPLSLTTADFDEDGTPDLICGYGYKGRGILTLQRGNGDAIYPNAPGAQSRKGNGTFSRAPFFSPAYVFEAPIAADLIGAGDFDGDGHWDIVVAARGGSELYLFSGDGRGELRPAKEIRLPGTITAMVSGEVNRRDGLTDIIVGVAGSAGSAVLIFEGPEGALNAKPEQIPLPAPPTALALGQLDDEYERDLAVAAGDRLFIIHGRDRKLSLDTRQQAGVERATIESRQFDEPISAVATGRFNGTERTDIALTTKAGALHILTSPLNDSKKQWAARAIAGWRDEVISDSARPVDGKVLPARLAARSADELIVINRRSRQAEIWSAGTAISSRIESLGQDSGSPVDLLPMRINQSGVDGMVALVSGRSAPVVLEPQASLTFTVNSAADTDDGVCNDANCTFREAINAANANPGADTINFSIGSGSQTISPTSALPRITDTVTIDGTTQPGFAGKPLIELNGSNAGNGADGLFLFASNSVVRGLVINRFSGNGIESNSPTAAASGDVFEGNYVGTDATGTAAFNNGKDAILIIGTINNRVGGTASQSRNVISGNLHLQRGLVQPDGNSIEGNYIGTDLTGLLLLGGGILISDGSDETIGGTTAGARNVVMGISITPGLKATGILMQGNFVGTDVTGLSRLAGSGISIDGNAATVSQTGNTIGGTSTSARNVIADRLRLSNEEIRGVQIQGNYIGVDVTGAAALGNPGDGVTIELGSNQNTIGGAIQGARNIISGNAGAGVRVSSASVANFIEGNFIGTDSTGANKLGNKGDGVTLFATSGQTIGDAAQARNVISNNGGNGVSISRSAVPDDAFVLVQNNYIGTDVTGTADMGNSHDGISILARASRSTIKENTIAFNRDNGINIPGTDSSAGVRNQIEFNGIFSNGALGINLGDAGITLNDFQDPDLGGNTLQNFPVLISASPLLANRTSENAGRWLDAQGREIPLSAAASLTIAGTLNSTPNTTFSIHLYFSGDAQCKDHQAASPPLASGVISGITTDSNGDAGFSFSFVFPPGSTSGVINGTATDANGNTSEFSECLSIKAPPTFQFDATSYNAAEAAGSATITVTRSGDASSAATIDYATADGTANQRMDYIITAGTLSFAAGETLKSFRVLLTDDLYVEGDETVMLNLSNPVGASLGSPATATLTIKDDDSTPATTNPLDDPQFFVKQQYYDFLSRAPDSGGWDYWTSQITQCADQACVRAKRVDVSNAFFSEQEYQQSGAYVYRLYRIAYGNHQPVANPFPDPNYPGESEKLPGYAVFAPDRARVVGGPSLAQAQLDLANTIVERPEFLTKYPDDLKPATFVDALLATIKNDLGVDLGSQRSALISLFNSDGRGAVLYRLADDNPRTNPIDNRALIDAEYNRAFVATEYFEYLRRDADIAGFVFWLGQIESAPRRDAAKQHALVCSFITAAEYQQRFSPVVTHTNSECAP